MEISLKFLILFAAVLQLVSTTNHGEIWISTNHSINKLDENFLSYGMDSYLIRKKWDTFDFNSVRLHTLAAGLGKAYLRLSGTDADRMTFDPHQESSDVPPFPASNFTMNRRDWDNINQFAKKVGWRIVFGLNAQIRKGMFWDPENARQLLSYSLKQGYADNLDFQLGNEPDLYVLQKYLVPITAFQLGKDYKTLKTILKTEFDGAFRNSMLVGPEIASAWSWLFLRNFVNTAGNVMDAVTWHQYYGGSNLKYLDNYTDPDLLDTYIPLTKAVLEAVRGSRYPNLPIWQGETSSTFAPVGNNLPESYVAGVMLLDKLGLSASLGLNLFVRQTFYGFWFALVDRDLMPTPNYWVALMYSTFVGNVVLKVDVKGVNPDKVRVYAHCTKGGAARLPNGTVTLYAMNLDTEAVDLKLGGLLAQSQIYEYLLTPGDPTNLQSTTIRLNGKLLQMLNNYTLPHLIGRTLPSGSSFVLPPRSFAFYNVGWPNLAPMPACKP